MNNYKLESEKPFNAEKVQNILQQVLTELIVENMVYDAEGCCIKAKWASDTIRARIKALEFDRYKIICWVTIGEKKSQDLFSCIRFLWDCERDRFATFVTDNMYLFAYATVVGLYYE